MTSEIDERSLTAVVAAFEERLVDGECVDWRRYLPRPSNPDFKRYALEMILVDIHHSWKRGVQRRLTDYLDDLPPECSADVAFRQAVVEEEWRSRKQSGEAIELDALLRSYGLPVEVESSGRSITRGYAVAKRLSEELDAILARNPEPFGFRVVEALGSGKLSRVFLGEQEKVGCRRIVVKVGVGPPQEIDAHGRLHHENIVPLYWAQSEPPYYVLCMPYFGRTTLKSFLGGIDEGKRKLGAGVLWEQLGGRAGFATASTSAPPFEHAVLWLGSRIARGLSHAHVKGVVHGDVKPENILLANNGEPMLLDFNVAAIGGSPLAGGTLPYMSPEQLLRQLGEPAAIAAESDLYSLGVVLFELAVGKRPFPDRPIAVSATLRRMIADRRDGVQWASASLSPSFRSIVNTCLAFDPADRYHTCDEFVEDVERHLDNRPLRRAPNPSLMELGRKQAGRAMSWLSRPGPMKFVLAGAAALALAAAYGGWSHLANSAAVKRKQLQAKFDDVRMSLANHDDRLDKSIAAIRAADELDRTHPFAEGWSNVGGLFWIGVDANERAALAADAQQIECLAAHALARFRKDLPSLAQRHGIPGDEVALLQRAMSRFPAALAEKEPELDRSDAAQSLVYAVRLLERGKAHQARNVLEDLLQNQRNEFWSRFWMYRCELQQGRLREAAAQLTTCLALRPNAHGLVLLRARVLLSAGLHPEAAREADSLIKSGHEKAEAHVIRGIARIYQKNLRAALADLDLAASLGADGPGLRKLMAMTAAEIGDHARAADDRGLALALPCRTSADWVAVIEIRLDDSTIDWAEIERAIPLALEKGPAASWSLWGKACSKLHRHGRPDLALQAVEEVCRSDVHPMPRLFRAELLRCARRYEEAANVCHGFFTSGEPREILYAAFVLAQCATAAPTSEAAASWRGESLRLLKLAAKAHRIDPKCLAGKGFELHQGDPEFEEIRSEPPRRATIGLFTDEEFLNGPSDRRSSPAR